MRSNGDYIIVKDGKEQVSGAAILLFGKNPQRFFQRAHIRFIRYDGNEEKVGREMNVVKDVTFKGRILEMTQSAIAYVKTQIKERTYLASNALFVTKPEYPEFCWTELIVNAVAHRDYSILGTDIQVKLFDNHFTVESPGILPGRVRLHNMRTTHFSRNPKIASFMKEYEFIREFGEGIDRMYRELEEGGWPNPIFKQDDFMFRVSLIANPLVSSDPNDPNDPNAIQIDLNSQLLFLIKSNPSISRKELSDRLNISDRRAREILKDLQESGVLKRQGTTRGIWIILK